MMDAALKKRWIAALRSGKYQQAIGTLREPLNGRMCCLGVLADIQSVDWANAFKSDDELETSTLPIDLRARLSLDDMIGLAAKNDGGFSFLMMADWIEKNL